MTLLVTISAAGLALFVLLYLITGNGFCKTMMITFGTTFYHFAVRLLAGGVINAFYHKRPDYTKKWFSELSFEKKLYRKLGVKLWKDKMPTYNPEVFSLENHSVEELIMATCQSELVHTANVVLSFVPVIVAAFLGISPLLVFILTSLAGAAFDLIFVIMQRYNRPRLIRLMNRQKR